MHDETHLIEQAQNGSQTAYKALYEAHVTPLYRFLRQYSSNTSDVEEWTQRAFIKAFQHLATFRGTSRFSTWLFTLALNEMRMDKRSAKRATFLFVETALDEAGSLPSKASNNISNEAADDFAWHDMMKAWLARLNDTKRAVFVLYEVEGYSHVEIAEILGIQESASRTTLTRTKQFLQQQWKHHCSEENKL